MSWARQTRSLVALASLLALCFLSLPGAAAAAEHVQTATIGEPGSGNGQLQLAPFVEPTSAGSGVAVNEATHDVYVADTGNARVEQFTAAGVFVRTFGSFGHLAFIAVDNDTSSPSHGDVYVADNATNTVSKFDASGALITSWGASGVLNGSAATGGPFTSIAGITVSPSGDLFVYDVVEPAEQNWFEFSQDGTAKPTVTVGRGTQPGGIATDSSGNLYKVVGNGNVEKFDSTGNDIGPVSSSGAVNTTTGFAIDPTNDDIYVDHSGTRVDRYDATCVPSGGANGIACKPVEEFGLGVLSSGAGLAIDGGSLSKSAYVADAGVDKVLAFSLVTAPTVTTGAANPVGANDATLNGTVNPNGSPLKPDPSEGCFFEWGLTTGYGNVESCQSPDAEEVGAGTSPVSVHADVSGLEPGTLYHFRLRAANANSTASPGKDEVFRTTGPRVEGESVSQVGATTALLRGLVDPNGQTTNFAFEYIDEDSYLKNPGAERFAGAVKAPSPAASIPATVSGSGDLNAASGSGNLAAGFTQITQVKESVHAGFSESVNHFTVGQLITATVSGTATLTSGSDTLTDVTTAEGSGTLTAGSTEVSGLSTTAGAFVPGQGLTGTGIQPGTTIASIEGETAQLSKAATASGVQALTADAKPLAPGQTISGEISPGKGIPAGTEIEAVNGQTITLSKAATASGAKVAVTVSALPSGTKVTAFDKEATTLTISQPAGQSADGFPLAAGSPRVANVKTLSGRFAAGQTITGPGIPADTQITAVEPGLLTISKAPTEPVVEASLSATGVQAALQSLSGLSPDTTYHFRLTATNPVATYQGEDKSFTTLAQAPPTLPDGRSYELVTPAAKLGEPFSPEPFEALGGTCASETKCAPGWGEIRMSAMQSTEDGTTLLYEGQPFSEGLRPGPNNYQASRGADGWGTEALSSALFDGSIVAVSADLSRSIVSNQHALTAEAPARGGVGFKNLYLRQGGVLQPLVTAEPPHRDPGVTAANIFQIYYQGANAGAALSPPLSHVLFSANDALTAATPFAPQAPIPPASKCNVGEGCNLYEWNEGQLRLVNVLPGAPLTASPGAVIGSKSSASESPDVDHAISDDGSRIFWSDATGQVYVRIDGEETVEVDDPGEFLTASPDGSKVLLDDGCLYDLASEECEDLTLDRAEAHQGGFRGILGASNDLSRVYFTDTKVLSGEEENANGESAVEAAGKFNLYRWQAGGEPKTTFVATLLEGDNRVSGTSGGGSYGDWNPAPARRTAQVSPDGRFLTFMSKAPLTGYTENKVQGGGKCGLTSVSPVCFEVFLYDAGTGVLACPSCNPSDLAPLGPANLTLFKNEASLADAMLAPPQNLTAGGRVFFESEDVLSPSDTNGHVVDVYEWEPNGIGSCKRAAGCVFLISSGHDKQDSRLVNSTPSGDDVFLTTRERLAPRDENEQIDIYDARAPHALGEAVGFPAGETAPCAAEACRGALTTLPPPPGAGSAQLSAAGNARSSKPKKHHKKHQKKKQRAKKRSAKHDRGGVK